MERPCEREPPHPPPPAPTSAPPATSPNPKPNPSTPAATSPVVAKLGATGSALVRPFGLAGSGRSEAGSAAAVAASEAELGGEEAAPEQLDWGSIDDEDGAFGQIGAAAATSEVSEPVLPGPQAIQKGKTIDGGASGSSPGVGSVFTPLDSNKMKRLHSSEAGGACSGATAKGGKSNE